MSPLLGTLSAFALILILARLKVPLWLAIFIGAVGSGIMLGLRPPELAAALGGTLIWDRTIGMVFITVTLQTLSEAMRRGGQMERIVDLAGALLRRPVLAMISLPALIGLLPMPGGALFSAPMVAAAAGKVKVDGGRLSAINYWFRHLWEYWWPLYPGVILAGSIAGRSLGQIALFHAPMSLMMLISGMVILRGMHPDLHARSTPPPPGTKRQFLWATSSIWIILLIWLFTWLPLDLLAGDSLPAKWRELVIEYVPIGLGLMAGVTWTIGTNRFTSGQIWRLIWRKDLLVMEALVFSILVFQFMLMKTQAASGIRDELVQYRVPPVLIVIALPFIAGMVTGAAMGFVGTSFPIIVAAMAGEPSIVPYLALAYAAGHMGQMLSPLHLCHVLSNRYFETTFRPVYRQIAPAAAINSTLVAAYCLLLWWVMR